MANSGASDAIMQELLRWAKDNKPEDKGWKGFFFSPGFIIAAVCIILVIVLLVVWWRWGKSSSAKAPDVESGGGVKKTPPDARSRSVRYVTSDGKAVPAEKVKR